jgi:hypothetical protein
VTGAARAQYNTCYWCLVKQAGKSPAEAQQILKVRTCGVRACCLARRQRA